MIMLTIQECRQFLDAKTNQSLDDKKVEAIRDDFYKLARIVLAAKKNGAINNCRRSVELYCFSIETRSTGNSL